MFRFYLFFAALLLASFSFASTSDNPPNMFDSPDVSSHWVSFIKNGNIWLVSKDGGQARQLTAHQGKVLNARFSPNGEQIAYTRKFQNNADVFVISTDGGASKQITFHPEEDSLVDWHPDGERLLIKSKRESYRSRFNQFYHVSANGGLPDKLPLPYGETAGYCDDQRLLFTYTLDFEDGNETWKRYKGGRAPSIWLYNPTSNQAQQMTQYQGIDIWPMCHKQDFYFASDRGQEQRVNLWKYSADKKEFKQISHFTSQDIRHPAMGKNSIVFENAGFLYRYDLASEKLIQLTVNVHISTEFMSPRFVSLKDNIQGAAFSDDGDSINFSARGDIINYQLDEGLIKGLARSSDAAERFPSLSSNGTLAFVSDKRGEYELYLQRGENQAQPVEGSASGYLFTPFWSGDGQYVVFVDEKQQIHLLDTRNKGDQVIARTQFKSYFALRDLKFDWSPDNQWILFTMSDSGRNQSTFVYSIEQQKLIKLTAGFFNDKEAVFCGNGAYICLLSQRSYNPTYGDVDSTWTYANSTSLYLLPLNKQLGSPTDLKPAQQKLSWQGISVTEPEKGIVEAKIASGNIRDLYAIGNNVVYLRILPGRKLAIYDYDLTTGKESKLATNARLIDVSAKSEVLIKDNKSGDYKVAKIAPEPAWKALDLSSYQLFIDPQLEKQQIVREAWRLYRDFYYDPKLHGKDWDKEWQRYEFLLSAADSKEELNRIVRALGGELEGGHVWATSTFARQRWKNTQAGLLGIDLQFDDAQNAYRITKVYQPAPWLHQQRSPLLEAGNPSVQGHYLLEINGNRLSKSESPWKLLYGYIDKPVELTTRNEQGEVNKFTVKAIANERMMREMEWVEQNRRYVDQQTNGEVGYIYVRDTSRLGQEQLMKQYQAQFDKKALIVDARFNSGGALGDRLVELLNRPVLNYFSTRNAVDSRLPELGNSGSKILLTNGWSYSGGDGFPFLFQQANVGPVLGERTWGGLIGPSQPIPLINGGAVSPPPQRVYDAKGSWDTGGDIGVTPDIPVKNTINALLEGKDEQLDRAISWTKNQIKQGSGEMVKPPILH